MHSAPSPTDPLHWLTAVLARDADRLFLETANGRRYSYGEFDALAQRLAAALSRRGVTCNDRVVAQIDKSPEAIALYVACLKLGAVFVPLNTAYTLAEVDYFLRDAQPRVAVVQPQQLQGVREIAVQAAIEHVETMGAAGEGSLLQLAAASQLHEFEHFPGDPAALAALLYTSGTTGRSKGAMLTRGNLASNAATLAALYGDRKSVV